MAGAAQPAARHPGGFYRAAWRWHFYAGLFCIPFVIWLALTGAIYLWRPQIEGWLDRPFDHLASAGRILPADAQVAAALRAVPGSTLHKYVVPDRPDAAVRILVERRGEEVRVYVDPRSLAVLRVATEERRPMRLLFHLHGELMAGAIGSYLVEIAACWAIVMLLTGLYLWWPRSRSGLAGVLYPRLGARGRLFWRDLHATAGLWVSLFALGLILTGLPWAKGWGSYLGQVRTLTGTSRGAVDWTIGGKAPQPDAMAGEHAGHGAMPMGPALTKQGELARVIEAVRPLHLAGPVLVSPPRAGQALWTAASDAADRPLRSTVQIDAGSGRIVSRTDFAQRHWIDRAIGYGVAAHEGALFGLANQLLGTVTALLLVLLSASGAVMWWRRRPVGLLGAPMPASRPSVGRGLVLAIMLLAVTLPLFGLTVIATLLAERFVLRRMPRTSRWLGLAGPALMPSR